MEITPKKVIRILLAIVLIMLFIYLIIISFFVICMIYGLAQGWAYECVSEKFLIAEFIGIIVGSFVVYILGIIDCLPIFIIKLLFNESHIKPVIIYKGLRKNTIIISIIIYTLTLFVVFGAFK